MTTISVPINLPNTEIIKITTRDNGDMIVRVKSTEPQTCCKHCGKTITKFHSLNKMLLLNHLPAFGNPVYIEFQPSRYQCLDCKGQPTTTQKLSWYQIEGKCTQPYAKYIINSLVNNTITDVAAQESISYKRVMSIAKLFPDKIDWTKIKSLKTIGMDEIALKKGHKDFVVIMSSKIDGKPVVLGILKDRKKQTVKDFLSSIPKDLAETVENVCCDMYDGYINAAKEIFGTKVKIIIDRFHVAKNYRDAIDSVRKQEMKRLKTELSAEDYKKFKNVMWLLRKKQNELSDDDQEILDSLFELSPLLKKAYRFQNKLTAIFNQSISQKQAKRKIKQWIKNIEKSGLTCFNTFIKTLNKLWNEILNYFVNRLNSGFIEGLNNKIKVLKRRCYGIFDVENLYRRISIDLAGYRSTI